MTLGRVALVAAVIVAATYALRPASSPPDNAPRPTAVDVSGTFEIIGLVGNDAHHGRMVCSRGGTCVAK